MIPRFSREDEINRSFVRGRYAVPDRRNSRAPEGTRPFSVRRKGKKRKVIWNFRNSYRKRAAPAKIIG